MNWVPQRPLHSSVRVFTFLAIAVGSFFLPAEAGAQPFGAWPVFMATTGSYIDIPSAAALNPTGAITIEAWVSLFPTSAQGENCRSVIGKNFMTSYWVGVCGNTLRSYLKGTASVRNGGTVPTSQFTHIAVTYDGVNRIHYINGEQVASFAETGALPTNGSNVRLGSDVSWDFQPQGVIDEVRLWNIARSVQQIRGSINVPITTAMPGLVAVWSLDAGGTDALGGHNGSVVGPLGFLNFPVALTCGTGTATSACLNTRFGFSVTFRNPNTGITGTGQVVDCPNPDSAVFWFFAPNAWEVMVKSINGCAFNDRYWAFSAGMTNVFYRLEVFDVKGGAAKIYFNYPDSPPLAVLDSAAFATCP